MKETERKTKEREKEAWTERGKWKTLEEGNVDKACKAWFYTALL